MLALAGSRINGRTKISYLHFLKKGGDMDAATHIRQETDIINGISAKLASLTENVEATAHNLKSISTSLRLLTDSKTHDTGDMLFWQHNSLPINLVDVLVSTRERREFPAYYNHGWPGWYFSGGESVWSNRVDCDVIEWAEIPERGKHVR